jgi:hypothetical protein
MELVGALQLFRLAIYSTNLALYSTLPAMLFEAQRKGYLHCFILWNALVDPNTTKKVPNY